MENSALTPENYQKGFLLDEEWMGGVAEEAHQPGFFATFILRHSTGEYVAYQVFKGLNLALSSINSVPRPWKFEATSECGGGNCGTGEEGGCGKGKCAQSCQTTGTCELTSE
jgi:hypothetical protein